MVDNYCYVSLLIKISFELRELKDEQLCKAMNNMYIYIISTP